MQKLCWVLLAAVLLLLPLGCGHPTEMVALTVTPTTAEVIGVGSGAQVQFQALGQFIRPDETRDVTNQVTWTSAAPSVVTVDAQGLATTGTNCGSVTITATAGQPLVGPIGPGAIIFGTATFTVADPSNPNCPQPTPTSNRPENSKRN